MVLLAALLAAGCRDNTPEPDKLPSSEAVETETTQKPLAVETPISPRFAVQAGAFADRGRAESLAQELSSAYKLTVLVAPAEVDGRLFHRVRIPAQTEAEAKALAARVGSEQKLKATVVHLP